MTDWVLDAACVAGRAEPPLVAVESAGLEGAGHAAGLAVSGGAVSTGAATG